MCEMEKALQLWTLSKNLDIECMSIFTPRGRLESVKRRVFPFAVNINDLQMMGHCHQIACCSVYSPYVLWYEA